MIHRVDYGVSQQMAVASIIMHASGHFTVIHTYVCTYKTVKHDKCYSYWCTCDLLCIRHKMETKSGWELSIPTGLHHRLKDHVMVSYTPPVNNV